MLSAGSTDIPNGPLSNVRSHSIAPRRVGAFRRFVYMPEYDLWADKICIIYTARPVRPLGPPSEAGHTAIWASPSFAARAVANPGDRFFVSQTLGV